MQFKIPPIMCHQLTVRDREKVTSLEFSNADHQSKQGGEGVSKWGIFDCCTCSFSLVWRFLLRAAEWTKLHINTLLQNFLVSEGSLSGDLAHQNANASLKL